MFGTLCIVITLIIISLIFINSIVLEKYYLYNKTKVVKNIYEEINECYANKLPHEQIKNKLNSLSEDNNLNILIKTTENIMMLTTQRNNENTENQITFFEKAKEEVEKNGYLYTNNDFEVAYIKDENTDVNYMVAFAKLANNYELYMKMPTADLQESARISNNVLLTIGIAIIAISGIIASVISARFTKPILELNGIAKKMSNLDFSQKYRIKDTEDEINTLGKSINSMSDKLENTIEQLTKNNSELEKDIEKKSKIDEMRKQFISDVSHELKTPIALIQGYAEGLVENVNADEESRLFYANVILDEANKMDALVKQLLELMKLEYGKREFNNSNFNIVSLIQEVIMKCNMMLDENNIKVNFDSTKEIMVYADPFYIEQIITNYLTNAIKYSKEINQEKRIDINILLNFETNKIRINVFNTGENIDENELQRIWGRFYKLDSSRNREKGGTGIGLAFVKAIMSNYKNKYGAINKENGIEFYFELDMAKSVDI